MSRMRYFPYGGTRTEEPAPGSMPTDKLFTGQQRETTNGLYHYKARLYNADIGRFPQMDTVIADSTNPGALNPYTYVLNNPVNHTDPTGHIWLSDGGMGPKKPVPVPGQCWVVAPTPYPCGSTPSVPSLGSVVPGLLYRVPSGGSGWSGGAAVPAAAPAAIPAVLFNPWVVAGVGAGVACYFYCDDAIDAIGQGTSEIAKTFGNLFSDGDETEITFGHGARHLEGTGLSEEDVDAAIEEDIRPIASDIPVGKFFQGTVTVEGRTIQYNGWKVAEGRIHVGTYVIPISEQ